MDGQRISEPRLGIYSLFSEYSPAVWEGSEDCDADGALASDHSLMFKTGLGSGRLDKELVGLPDDVGNIGIVQHATASGQDRALEPEDFTATQTNIARPCIAADDRFDALSDIGGQILR